MRVFVLVVALALPATGVLAVEAFNRADFADRVVEVHVVGDAQAYLSIDSYASNPHACVVTTSGGLVRLNFNGCFGSGTGINPGSASDAGNRTTYWFHDLLVVTNKGTKPILVWVNATTESGSASSITVGRHASPAFMTSGAYADQAGATPLGVGEDMYVGVSLHSGSLTTGSITGKLRFTAKIE